RRHTRFSRDWSSDVCSSDLERLDLYERYWRHLLEKGLAYKCYCTEEELEREREEQAARGETPRYSGLHRHLTEAQQQAFEAEGQIGRASCRERVKRAEGGGR